MRAVISPALFLIQPSENIYWTNYDGLPSDFLPVLHVRWQRSQYCAKASPAAARSATLGEARKGEGRSNNGGKARCGGLARRLPRASGGPKAVISTRGNAVDEGATPLKRSGGTGTLR